MGAGKGLTREGVVLVGAAPPLESAGTTQPHRLHAARTGPAQHARAQRSSQAAPAQRLWRAWMALNDSTSEFSLQNCRMIRMTLQKGPERRRVLSGSPSGRAATLESWRLLHSVTKLARKWYDVALHGAPGVPLTRVPQSQFHGSPWFCRWLSRRAGRPRNRGSAAPSPAHQGWGGR